MRLNRLFWHVFLYCFCITLGILLLIAFSSATMFRTFFLEQTGQYLDVRAQLFSESVLPLLNHPQALDRHCKAIGKATNTRFTVILSDGTVIADTLEIPARMDNHANRPEIRTAFADASARSIRHSRTLDESMMYVAVPFSRDGHLAGAVRAALPIRAVDQILFSFQKSILLIGGAGIVLLAACALFISRRISAPLEQMRISAEHFARGELSHPVPVAATEELAALGDAMASMAQELDARIRTILQQQNQMESVLASMVEGALALDNHGRVLNLNQAGATLLELDRTAVKNRLIHEVLRKPDLLRFVEETLTSTIIRKKDLQLCTPKQEDLYLRAHGTPLYDAQKQKLGALVVLHDVTQLVRLENLRRDFVANVSHELRTPITSIKGFVETLLEGALENPEDAKRFLDVVLRQTDRLNAIIEDLLTLSRIERQSEQHTIECESVLLQDVLHNAIEMCATHANAQHIALQIICAPDLLAKANASLLEQAVINLLTNAITYSPAHTTVQIGAEVEEDHIVIRVKDEGCGIAPEHLPRLFERFYRVDKARSRSQGGTGLGLAIVKHIALAHQGTVSAESTPGKGSIFCIRFPACVF